MGAARIIILVVAAVAALGLALVVRQMAAGKPQAPAVAVAAPAPETPKVRVLVAKRDLPVGARLAASDIGWQTWPADAVNPAFITDGKTAPRPPSAGVAKIGAKAAQAAEAAQAAISGDGAIDSLNGAIVREPFLANEPITQAKLVRTGEGGFMSVVVQPGMRALALPVTVESGAGGFILPGDRVDVLMSRKLDAPNPSGGGSSQIGVAVTVLNNLRVLAVDQQVKPEKDAKSIVGATVTLEVPAADVELLLRSKAQGDLSLALRSYADMAGPPGRSIADAARSEAVRIVRAGRSSEVAVR